MRHIHHSIDTNNPLFMPLMILAALLGMAFISLNGGTVDNTFLGRFDATGIVTTAVYGLLLLAALSGIYMVIDWWFDILVELPETEISQAFNKAGFMMLMTAAFLGIINMAFYLLWIIAGFSYLCMFVYAINCLVCKSPLENPIEHKGKTYCQGCLDSLKEDFGPEAA